MINRLPFWFKQDLPDIQTSEMTHLLSGFGINTVCQKAKCPNTSYCFKKKHVTFMILGDTCTRNCRFCNVGTVLNSKQNSPPKGDSLRLAQEPYLISEVVKILDLNYVVITSVSRDDLDDGGAGQFARTLELIHEINQDIKIEVLIPDFQDKVSSLECVLKANPFIIAHNIETVNRLYQELRPEADYELSLNILKRIKQLKPEVSTKSSIILGLGETREEVIEAMQDLRKHNCDILTLGQYLAPSSNHYPVKEFISPKQFKEYEGVGMSLGFKAVLSGPLVRSSYKAEEISKEFICV